jgi:hypothetical protein
MIHITRRPHLQSLRDPFHRYHRLRPQPHRQRHLARIPFGPPAVPNPPPASAASARKLKFKSATASSPTIRQPAKRFFYEKFFAARHGTIWIS